MKLNPLVLDAIEKRAQRAGRLKGGTYFEAQGGTRVARKSRYVAGAECCIELLDKLKKG